MSDITVVNKARIDTIVLNIPSGSTKFFWEISVAIWGKRAAASRVGEYLATQRSRPVYPYWRVVNDDGKGGGHPVAEVKAIKELEKEGHVIINGGII